MEPVSYRRVTIADSFWAPRQKALDANTMRQQFEMLVQHKYKQNFERAAARQKGGYEGFVFNDSDVYKVLEAAAYSLGRNPNQPELTRQVDAWVDLISRAQEPDGYLNTHFQLMAPDQKWTNLRDQHELYCAGHLFEAAAAHYEATGKKTLLNVATKLADHIDARFGPGKKMGYPGHPETELALFKLWRATGEDRYYRLAEFFLNSRGTKFFATEHNTPLDRYNGDYWSDNRLLRDHEEIVGHAVRAAYLFAGATDLAHETGDPALIAMLDRVWESNTNRRMFVTGGLGPSGSNEGFTVDYDLPTFTAYQESCAGIANALWNWRMTNLHGETKYADVLETALYNGAISGLNLRGDRYYYTNPLASEGGHHRREWHACACCPPNLARLVGQVGGMAYAASKDAVAINLFFAGKAQVREAGQDVDLTVTTDYPWDGKVVIRVDRVGKQDFILKARKPGWLETDARVNGQPLRPDANGYLNLGNGWKAGDTVTLDFPMTARRVLSHPNVAETFGMAAFARGPVIYCAEAADNAIPFQGLGVPMNAPVTAKKVKDKDLGTFAELRVQAQVSEAVEWSGKLFQSAPTPKPVDLRLIPYAYWDNRTPGSMRVWFSPNPEPAPLRGLERDAKVTLSFVSGYCQPNGVKDGFRPPTSNPNSPQQMHFWPHKGGEETVEYSWSEPRDIRRARVFWFDDTGRGEVKVPKAWRMEAWVGGHWQPVQLSGSSTYGLKLDVWNEIKFAPVRAQRVRLVLSQQPEWASGIHEWQLFSD